MTTTQRLDLLQSCAELFEPWTGVFDAEALAAWVRAELGAEEALDQALPHGPLLSRARAPQHLLHIVSENTPHAAYQTLLRGLVVGSDNVIKLPASGLPEFELAVASLPPDLAALVTLTHELPDDWKDTFDALVIFGSDETIAWFASRLDPTTRFLPHGQRLSIALVEAEPELAAKLAARDVSLFDQRGCLSVHDVYVAESSGLRAREFAVLLAEEMQRFNEHVPRAPLSSSASGAITNLRETVRFLAANRPDHTALWESPGGTAWTVIYESDSVLKLSCLNRVVFVKPWPEANDLPAGLGPARRHLSTLALHPFDEDRARDLCDLNLGATRICPLGHTQDPSIFWHHDGLPTLASLVTWIDLG